MPALKPLFCVHEDELFILADELFLVMDKRRPQRPMSCFMLYSDFDQVHFRPASSCS